MSRRDKNNIQLIEKPFAICLYKQVITLLGYILMTNIANAACTPTPDCASIGYTETSCEGASLKCPFDITKMKCMPCDSSYRYNCTGDNITGGVGDTCGGKYVTCACSEGSVFQNGACACDNSCTVGAIYYSDGTCSACVDSNKTAVGVVVKDNELVASIDIQYQYWSADRVNISGITETTDSSVAKADMDGKAHTLAIVDHYGVEVDTSSNAGVYCYNYAPAGMESTKNQWYLPAAGEIYEYFYGGGTNYSKINATWTKLGISLSSKYFWSSSEYSTSNAWRVGSSGGNMGNYDKFSRNNSVSCLLAL